MMAGKDRISELPINVLDTILGFLLIDEAARMAVLSSFWRDIWFSLTQLNFDPMFFKHIQEKYSIAHSDISAKKMKRKKKYGNICTFAGLDVMNQVLMQHTGFIRKFVLDISQPPRNRLRSRSLDYDQWLFFITQKGVEEICLKLKPIDKYSLPSFIFSCPSLKRLHICGVSIKPLNAHCTLPNVTSLCFEFVNFDSGDLSVHVPMLNDLSFIGCNNMSGFNIAAQKLEDLAITNSRFYQLPVNLDLRSIGILELDSASLKDFVDGLTRRGPHLQPSPLNVIHLMLSSNYDYLNLIAYEQMNDISPAFIQLLQICPKLCTLDMDLRFSNILPTLSELLHNVGRRDDMLHTLEVDEFEGREDQNFFIKGLLVCFPTLEKVFIIPASVAKWITDFENKKQKILRFAGAYSKAEIIFCQES